MFKVLNLVLLPIPEINIYGAAIGSVACHIVASSISFIILSRNISLDIDVIRFLVKPIIINVIMGLLAWGSFVMFNGMLPMSIATICAILVAVVSYVLMIVLLRVLHKEDYYMVPGGKIIVKVLEKLKSIYLILI